jgi:rsbT co-antagonist protein RsbR
MAAPTIVALLERHRDSVLQQWLRELTAQDGALGKGRLGAEDLQRQAEEFFSEFMSAYAGSSDSAAPEWAKVRAFLEHLSRERVRAGFSSDETAMFIFSLKRALFNVVSGDRERSKEQLSSDLWQVSELLDKLGLRTVTAFQRGREEVINRQQQELLELSTPVIKLWDSILALPLIGTLDSARTQVVMESLLQKIVETESQVAIIDITGVPTVDTLVAQHLLKTITAARLMGAECIISGVRPQIAQTIVHLGINLEDVVTKAKLSDALALALQRSGRSVVRSSESPSSGRGILSNREG